MLQFRLTAWPTRNVWSRQAWCCCEHRGDIVARQNARILLAIGVVIRKCVVYVFVGAMPAHMFVYVFLKMNLEYIEWCLPSRIHQSRVWAVCGCHAAEPVGLCVVCVRMCVFG